MKRVEDADLIAAIYQEKGLITYVAARVGISPQAIRERINRDPDLFKPVIAEAREQIVDRAERALEERLEDGDTAAITFTLRTLGRSRGYAERTEITGAEGGPVELGDARGVLAAKLAAHAAGGGD